MRSIAAFAVCALVHVATGFETTGFQLKENINVPKGWTRVGAAPADHTIKLQVGLYQSNFDSLERQLLEVSDRACSGWIAASRTDMMDSGSYKIWSIFVKRGCRGSDCTTSWIIVRCGRVVRVEWH
jgi:hypothetical protein